MAVQEAVIRSRIDARSKDAAAAVFEELGMTMSDGIRLFLRQVAATQSIPFEIKTPNAASRRAIAQTKAIEARFSSIDELMEDLGSGKAGRAAKAGKAAASGR